MDFTERMSELLETKAVVDTIVSLLEDKKAKDVSVINIERISVLTDYFVICSGTSTTHIRALADEVETKLKEQGIEFYHKEGYETCRWVLLDYGEVVIHIFHQEDREFYNLERLWYEGIKKHIHSAN